MENVVAYEKLVIFSFVLPVLTSLGLLWFLLLYQKKKFQYQNDQKDAQLREQALIIQNQSALDHERNRIASEMHDDLGSGLTSIKYLSDEVISKTNDVRIKEDIQKISAYSSMLVHNMSEIIWAMNSRFDNIEGMISYLRRYCVEYLDDHNINNSFTVEDIDTEMTLTGEKRRNLFLVVKEILHNSVKYANASEIKILVSGKTNLKIKIEEVGAIGFDPQDQNNKGNGLFNIEKRIKTIEGNITYVKSLNGMVINVSLPIMPNKKTNEVSE